ncbi:MAG: hypothetical protein ACRCSN_05295 [Dermatophilaceae bacterium]
MVVLASLTVAMQPVSAETSQGPQAREEFVLDPADYPGATHFLFLESSEDQISREYRRSVSRFVDGMASQPGFRASMTLAGTDLKRMVVYYQFETEADYTAARNNPKMIELFGPVSTASARTEDFATNPLEQIPANSAEPLPDYSATFKVGDGVGINEALVNPGREQAELTALMREAGVVANPNDSEGFIDFTFHEAIDGSRNMNLLHWTSVRTMSVAALGPLVQNLINGGFTGGTDGWGPDGPGLIGVHVYEIEEIRNA